MAKFIHASAAAMRKSMAVGRLVWPSTSTTAPHSLAPVDLEFLCQLAESSSLLEMPIMFDFVQFITRRIAFRHCVLTSLSTAGSSRINFSGNKNTKWKCKKNQVPCKAKVFLIRNKVVPSARMEIALPLTLVEAKQSSSRRFDNELSWRVSIFTTG